MAAMATTDSPGAAAEPAAAAADRREQQLSSALDDVRTGCDSTLEALRQWRTQREADEAAERARYAAELAADRPIAAFGTAVRADPLGEGLDRAQMERVRALTAARGGERPAREAPERGGGSSVHAMVAAKLDLLGSTPPGLDPSDGDAALQARLQRELMAKYGMADGDGGDGNEGLQLRLAVSRYAAGLDSLLGETEEG